MKAAKTVLFNVPGRRLPNDNIERYFTRYEKNTDKYREPFIQKYPFDSVFPLDIFADAYLTYPFHWHKYIEMIHVLRGRMTASLNGVIYKLGEGDIFVVNSDMIHGYFDGGPETYALTMIFGLDLFEQSLADLYDPVSHAVVFGRKVKITENEDPLIQPELSNIFLAIYKEFASKKDGYRIAIKRKLYEMALLFLRDISPEQNVQTSKLNQNYPALERIFSYIYQHYDNPDLSLEKAATNTYLSKFYFARFFRERTGMTFHTYLSKYRINRVQELLQETDDPITDIAYNCGFASIKTFNRLFKLYTGVSPSDYRRGPGKGNI
ncbi:MAG: AraC family transcriptional regulator [Treponema sp.]|jgi:AraC-like DNA-binding protein|nr:AraC family transcriptional regulator [Treponema sp.]